MVGSCPMPSVTFRVVVPDGVLALLLGGPDAGLEFLEGRRIQIRPQALRDDHVDARPDDLFGVLDLADHRHDLGAIGMEPIHPRFRIAKAGIGIYRWLY